MATSVKDLMAQREELDRKIAELQKADRSAAIEKIRAMMGESGLTMADISGRVGPGTAKATRRSGGGAGVKIAPKYRDDQGNTWSGRGLQPKWLKAAIAGGAKLDDFTI